MDFISVFLGDIMLEKKYKSPVPKLFFTPKKVAGYPQPYPQVDYSTGWYAMQRKKFHLPIVSYDFILLHGNKTMTTALTFCF